jgi:hypothetical protein
MFVKREETNPKGSEIHAASTFLHLNLDDVPRVLSEILFYLSDLGDVLFLCFVGSFLCHMNALS